MRYKITKEQLQKVIPRLEKLLSDYFSDDDRICGFKIFINDDIFEDGDDDLIDVFVLFNQDWVSTDQWSGLRSGHIKDKVREHLKNITPLRFGIYSHSKKC